MAKNNEFRFAVGTRESVESSVWKVWVQGDEVYLGARDSLHFFKVSLHQSGIWRMARVADLKGADSTSDRVIVKWRRPVEFAPGWTPSVGIVVTSVRPMRPFGPTPLSDDRLALTWFPPPSPGKRLVFKVLFSRANFSEEDLRRVSLPQDRLATRMVKRNGELVWLVAREDDLTDLDEHHARDAMSKTRIHLRARASPNGIRASRVLLMVSDDEPTAQPTIYDIPLGLENLS